MSHFTELFAYITNQMEDLLKDWKEDNIHDLCSDCDDDCEGYEYEEGKQDLEPFFLEYTNSDYSLEYYKINDEELNDSYREGSLWILEKLTEYSVDCDDIIDTLKKMSQDNREYAKQLIYFIGTEL